MDVVKTLQIPAFDSDLIAFDLVIKTENNNEALNPKTIYSLSCFLGKTSFVKSGEISVDYNRQKIEESGYKYLVRVSETNPFIFTFLAPEPLYSLESMLRDSLLVTGKEFPALYFCAERACENAEVALCGALGIAPGESSGLNEPLIFYSPWRVLPRKKIRKTRKEIAALISEIKAKS